MGTVDKALTFVTPNILQSLSVCTVDKALTSNTPGIFTRVSVCTVDKALTSLTSDKFQRVSVCTDDKALTSLTPGILKSLHFHTFPLELTDSRKTRSFIYLTLDSSVKLYLIKFASLIVAL